MHPLLERIITSDTTPLPIVLDEESAREVVIRSSGIHITSLDECRGGAIPGISLYEKNLEEDKKHLSVKDIRGWITDIAQIPYEKRHIYILRDFDEATTEAMNASLKLLEEPPSYALVLLVVSNPESLLDTIASRTLRLYQGAKQGVLPSEIEEALEMYRNGDPTPLVKYLSKEKVERDTALDILSRLSPMSHGAHLEKIESAMIALYTVNETPRNILDPVILFPTQKDPSSMK